MRRDRRCCVCNAPSERFYKCDAHVQRTRYRRVRRSPAFQVACRAARARARDTTARRLFRELRWAVAAGLLREGWSMRAVATLDGSTPACVWSAMFRRDALPRRRTL